ncbi:MAG: Fe-S cluster assembly protein SufB [Candidatus Woesearchaeota archaeon]|jgi:Fe-S cluster assembly protein SufB|nr:Fe-S cluster assembly protein SufB [Candidatus Woesearchaeota archaeon]MDP7324365.1 Fe-S cluster assembly protein SufB [Candidatus Woesearchaeota archaeon]MDP7457803.1 Fe-S cluster assembly protein SufB [Candidatus Woesearchaeota archaeon]
MKKFEINRETYDHYNKEKLSFKAPEGVLTEKLVRKISASKKEPKWMLEKRLKGLKFFNELPYPTWGPDLSKLDLKKIHFFMLPDAKANAENWEDVPEEIRNTYEKLGIPEAERKSLGGVGAQYESQVVYHKLKEELTKQGVVFLDCDEAIKEYPELVKKYFMTTCVPINLHKFTALHAAVWSGGTFIYIPKGVKVKLPLQAYFRMNAQKGGQFEHTLIIVDEGAEVSYIEGCSAPQYTASSIHAGCVEIHILKGARARYSSIENWSRNTFNLNTKRAAVYEDGVIEWVNGNLGSAVTMLYPASILIGDRAKSDFIGIAFAGKGQNQDTGCKTLHVGKNTSSTITSKSISKDGGITSYRGLLSVQKGAKNAKSSVNCDALMMDNKSQSNTFPYMDVKEPTTDLAHEATVGKISQDQIFYLMSRGLDEQTATQMIVSGFVEPIVKELPLEYAVELNRLIELEMEGSLG